MSIKRQTVNLPEKLVNLKKGFIYFGFYHYFKIEITYIVLTHSHTVCLKLGL